MSSKSEARALRHRFLRHPVRGLGVIGTTLIGLIGLMAALGVAVTMLGHWSVFAGVCFAFVSALTIGSGDLAPETGMGSWLAVVSGVAALAVAATAYAASLAPAARAEIDALLTRLETSSCTFERNGTWYPAAEAKAHLLRKLSYLEDRGAVSTAEEFIERAASGSSTSGQPYRVKCSGYAPVESSAWMKAQLGAIRTGGRVGSPATK